MVSEFWSTNVCFGGSKISKRCILLLSHGTAVYPLIIKYTVFAEFSDMFSLFVY